MKKRSRASPDLVLDLPLFPTGGRRARHRLDEIMTAHLQETAVELAILANKHRLHRRLHVVVDAARAGSLEKGKRPIVGVEHHLLRLARIGAHEQHPAVAEADVRHLHRHRRAAQHDDLVAPIKLVRFARRKAQRHIGFRHRRPALPAPGLGVAPHRVVAPLIAKPAQVLEHANQRQPFPRHFQLIR